MGPLTRQALRRAESSGQPIGTRAGEFIPGRNGRACLHPAIKWHFIVSLVPATDPQLHFLPQRDLQQESQMPVSSRCEAVVCRALPFFKWGGKRKGFLSVLRQMCHFRRILSQLGRSSRPSLVSHRRCCLFLLPLVSREQISQNMSQGWS